jgi:hypothetical protein
MKPEPQPRVFFRPNEENYTVCSWGQTVSTLGKSTVNERWHSSHNVDALKTVILCCTNTIIKDSYVQNCPYIFCFWTSKLYVGIKTHDSEVVLGTSWLLSLYQTGQVRGKTCRSTSQVRLKILNYRTLDLHMQYNSSSKQVACDGFRQK